MNAVQIIGNISNEIDIRYTPNGHAIARFNLAVNNPFNREKVSFVPIEVWRKQAENVSSYCSKGSKVGIVGHIEIDQYEKDGQRRTFTKVVANSVEFLTPKRDRQATQSNYQASNQGDPFSGESISDDQLPF